MKALEARSRRRGGPRALLAVAGVVLLAAAATGAYLLGRAQSPSSAARRGDAPAGGAGARPAGGDPGRRAAGGGGATGGVRALRVVSSTPADGATGVASDATVTITFSDRLTLGSAQPQVTPAVPGQWVQHSAHTIEFDPSAALVPFTHETVTVPGGATGVKAIDGSTLTGPYTFGFTVADGSMLRLQQLLAGLQYLPLNFVPSGPAPAPSEMAQPQPGSFAWRWSGLPTELTSLWTPGAEDVITKGAIMTFEDTHDLAVDGLAGPEVWRAVLADTAAFKLDPAPYDYVLVSKVQPENLTLWDDGAVKFADVLVNTGLPGADTTDGTYPVFEHVVSSDMKGTNPDGSKYNDPDVPWASYFNGGDALHGFVRASYGFPQSNGCVEMPVATAGMLWPYTPIGTLVTVVGPAS